MRQRLKSICDYISRGATPDYVDESPYKVMNQATFSKGYIDESNLRYTSNNSESALIRKGDLLMASTGGGVLGKVVFFDKEENDFYADSHVSILRNSKGTNSMKFLYYWFSTRYDEINATMVKGSTNQTELQRNYLVNYEIDIPTLEVQQRIVSYLDTETAKIDHAIELLKKKREAYTRLKASVINRAVTRGLNPNVKLKDSGVEWIGMIPEGWEVKRIKNLCDYVTRGSTPNYVDYSLYKVMNQATFSKGYIDDERVRYSDKMESYSNIKKDDLLIASTGGGILGKLLYFENNENDFYADTHVTIMRSSDYTTSTKFLYYAFYTKYDMINATMVKGSTNQTELQRNYLLNYELPIPSLSEQHAIASYLDTRCARIDKAAAIVDKQIDAYTRLKKSLINEVVTGKRRV